MIKDFKKFKVTKIESDKGIDIKDLDKPEKLEDNEYTIVSISDVSTFKPANVDEATIINADLNKEIKRGEVLYITAMVQKKNTNWNSMAVFKVRVVDMYKGLSILNSLK